MVTASTEDRKRAARELLLYADEIEIRSEKLARDGLTAEERRYHAAKRDLWQKVQALAAREVRKHSPQEEAEPGCAPVMQSQSA